ncbi:hypothetical protein COO60DRAFT_1465765, partial [Scenedesmus sp. NREL 46B-D3]
MQSLGCHSPCRACQRRRKLKLGFKDLKQHLHLSSSSGKWLIFAVGSRPLHGSSNKTKHRCWQGVRAALACLAGQCVGRRSRGPAVQQLTRKDFHLLQLPREWLNDELLNYYLLLLQVGKGGAVIIEQLCASTTWSAAGEPRALNLAAKGRAGSSGQRSVGASLWASSCAVPAATGQSLRSDAIMQLQTRLHAALQQLDGQRSSIPQPLRVLLQVPRSYVFSSFFYARLAPGPARYCYTAVQRWTQQRRTCTPGCVLAYELLLFPINLRNTHWAVSAVWPQAGVLQYFDPLEDTRAARTVLATLARWLLQDAADKGVALPYTAQQLRLELAPEGMPAQLDGHSCGVFAAVVCERLAAGWQTPFDFSQGDVPGLRLGMALDSLGGARRPAVRRMRQAAAAAPACCRARCCSRVGGAQRHAPAAVPCTSQACQAQACRIASCVKGLACLLNQAVAKGCCRKTSAARAGSTAGTLGVAGAALMLMEAAVSRRPKRHPHWPGTGLAGTAMGAQAGASGKRKQEPELGKSACRLPLLLREARHWSSTRRNTRQAAPGRQRTRRAAGMLQPAGRAEQQPAAGARQHAGEQACRGAAHSGGAAQGPAAAGAGAGALRGAAWAAAAAGGCAPPVPLPPCPGSSDAAKQGQQASSQQEAQQARDGDSWQQPSGATGLQSEHAAAAAAGCAQGAAAAYAPGPAGGKEQQPVSCPRSRGWRVPWGGGLAAAWWVLPVQHLLSVLPPAMLSAALGPVLAMANPCRRGDSCTRKLAVHAHQHSAQTMPGLLLAMRAQGLPM